MLGDPSQVAARAVPFCATRALRSAVPDLRDGQGCRAAIGSIKRLDLGGVGSGTHDILHSWADKIVIGLNFAGELQEVRYTQGGT